MDFEHRALSVLPSVIARNAIVSAPVVYEYDAENHVLHVQDGGPRTLKEAYVDQTLDIESFGRELGQWLAGFHQNTKAANIGDNKTAKAIYRFAYSNLSSSLEKFGFEPSLGQSIDQQYGSLLSTDDECLCHGDFWPGNVVVNGQKLTVVDWEMVRKGCGATDVGQFAAEAWLLDRFRGGRALLRAFLEGYRGAGELVCTFLFREHPTIELHFESSTMVWGGRQGPPLAFGSHYMSCIPAVFPNG